MPCAICYKVCGDAEQIKKKLRRHRMRAKQDRWSALDLDPGLDKALPKLLSLIGVSVLICAQSPLGGS